MFARAKIVVFFFVVVLLNNSFTLYIPNRNTANWLKGTWQGMGVQVDSPTQLHSWSMVFYANPDKNSYLVEYPSIPCKGVWKLVKIDKNKAEFIEIVEEKDRCYDNGYIIVTYVNRNHISFSWFREKGSKVMAYSTLVRIDN